MEILPIIFSEQWAIVWLFLTTLFWLYKIAKWFGASYLKLQEEHNKAFLKSFDNMIDKISTGDEAHSKEHSRIMDFLEDKHKNNNVEHKDIIKLVWQIDWNVKKNTDNIEILSKEIRLHHST